jgi:drug/metabolite transporter (DMT)-like permease
VTARRAPGAGGLVIALSAAIAYGVTVVIGRDLARAGIAGSSALASRFGLSALFLAVWLALRRRAVVPPPGERLATFLLGAVGYALESSFFFAALGRGTAAAVTMLFYSYPAMVLLIEVALGQITPSVRLLVALALTVSGSVVVLTAGDQIAISGAGVAFALAAAATFCCYLLLGERVARHVDPAVKAMWVAGGASLSLAVRAVVTGADAPAGSRVPELLAYGAANSAAFALMFAALARIGPTRTAVALTFELVAAVVMAAVFLDEPVRAVHVAGGLAVLGGAVLAALIPHPEEAPPPS